MKPHPFSFLFNSSPGPHGKAWPAIHRKAAFGSHARVFWLIGIAAWRLSDGSSLLAQWQTQSVALHPGWNAVYLHVDASHFPIAEVAPSPIDEIWQWQPAFAPDRFLEDPQQPIVGSDWASWHRPEVSPESVASDTLLRLSGNAAYLVKNGGGTSFNWLVKGKPVPPSYQWTSRGVNFIGFSTPDTNPPLFSNFLGPVQRLAAEGEFYRYDDGNNDLTPTLFNALFNAVTVKRGNAVWIRHANEFNRYFGAFEVTLQSSSGIHFHDFIDQYTLKFRNQTANGITVTLSLLDSETPPAEQPAIVGKPPLIRRGEFNAQNLSYGFTTFDGLQTVNLSPQGEVGSEAEVVIGVNRLSMNANTGDLFAGILRLTDSLGHTQVDLPVSVTQTGDGATFASGLWVGNAIVNQVRHYLKNYEKDSEGNLVTQAVTENGAPYVVASVKDDLGSVAQPFNLRLIVHKSDSETRLFQRIYHGLGLGQTPAHVLTSSEDALSSDYLDSARRISAVHLPFTDENSGWPFTGQFAQGQTVSAQISLGYDDYKSNPFLHTYHPDHDNLNATFESAQIRGAESYSVDRNITLVIAPPSQDFKSVVSAGNEITGQYSEEITLTGFGSESRRIDTAGVFLLKRISDINTITTTP